MTGKRITFVWSALWCALADFPMFIALPFFFLALSSLKKKINVANFWYYDIRIVDSTDNVIVWPIRSPDSPDDLTLQVIGILNSSCTVMSSVKDADWPHCEITMLNRGCWLARLLNQECWLVTLWHHQSNQGCWLDICEIISWITDAYWSGCDVINWNIVICSPLIHIAFFLVQSLLWFILTFYLCKLRVYLLISIHLSFY